MGFFPLSFFRPLLLLRLSRISLMSSSSDDLYYLQLYTFPAILLNPDSVKNSVPSTIFETFSECVCARVLTHSYINHIDWKMIDQSTSPPSARHLF